MIDRVRSVTDISKLLLVSLGMMLRWIYLDIVYWLATTARNDESWFGDLRRKPWLDAHLRWLVD